VSSALLSEAKKLGSHAAVYLVPSLLVRGLTFLLTPLYTRTMSQADFGLLGVATSVGGVISILLGLALHGAITRLYFDCKDESDRRRLFGTILTLFLAGPTVGLAALWLANERGLGLLVALPLHPHMQLVLAASWLSTYASMPTAMYMAREEPAKVAGLNVFLTLTQLVFTIGFVVGLRQGVIGVLRGTCAANAVNALVSVILVARHASMTFDRRLARETLAFGLPLVPHLVANWALSVSDRLILVRYVPPVDLGIYSLAYVFAFLVGTFAGAVTSAFSPIATRLLMTPGREGFVPPLGTAALAFIAAVSVALASFADEALTLLAPSSYAPARRLVPWVILGGALQGLYLVWSMGTWFSKKTSLVPLVTVSSAALNVLINLALVPRYGVIVAAVSTAVSYAFAAGLHGWLAHRNYAIKWQYGRWTAIALVSLAAYALAHSMPGGAWGMFGKAVIVCLAYPAVLVATGVVPRRLLMSLRTGAAASEPR
jgi:O-antigen/teichoic acid export membrane protein